MKKTSNNSNLFVVIAVEYICWWLISAFKNGDDRLILPAVFIFQSISWESSNIWLGKLRTSSG